MMQSLALKRKLHGKEDLMLQKPMLEDRGSIEEMPPRAGVRACVRRERRHSPSGTPAFAWGKVQHAPDRGGDAHAKHSSTLTLATVSRVEVGEELRSPGLGHGTQSWEAARGPRRTRPDRRGGTYANSGHVKRKTSAM